MVWWLVGGGSKKSWWVFFDHGVKVREIYTGDFLVGKKNILGVYYTKKQ
jgi:hypothetical protein